MEDDNGLRVSQPSQLLDAWAAKDDLSKRTSVREYSTLISGEDLVKRPVQYGQVHGEEPLFTLNFAAWLRAPHNVPTVVSAYVKSFPDEEEITRDLKARPVQRGAGKSASAGPRGSPCYDDRKAEGGTGSAAEAALVKAWAALENSHQDQGT